MKIKNLFATPKKAFISSSCIVLALAGITVGSVAVTGAAAERNSIGQIAAENAALADAGVKLAEAFIYRTEFDFDDGQYVYEVEFTANGAEYDYKIAASDGKILARDIEPMDGGALNTKENRMTVQGQVVTTENVQNKPAERTGADAQSKAVDAAADRISVGDAKEIALADAGKAASDVTFTKERADWEDGVAVYDVEFYTADNGTYISVDEAKSIAASHAGLAPADIVFRKAKLENDDGRAEYEVEFYKGTAEYDYTIDAVNGTILEYDFDYND